MNKFITSDGFLTDYAFACGYEEVAESKTPNIVLRLFKEGPVYHVRVHNHTDKCRISWDSFDTLEPARKAFLKKIKLHDLERTIPKY